MDYHVTTSLFFCQPVFKKIIQNSADNFAVRHKRKWLTNPVLCIIIIRHLRECWNGRQARLRCVWLRRVGSSPISRTMISPPRTLLRGGFWRYIQTSPGKTGGCSHKICSFCFISETGVSLLKRKTGTQTGTITHTPSAPATADRQPGRRGCSCSWCSCPPSSATELPSARSSD